MEPLKTKDRDWLPTDGGDGIPRQPLRDGFKSREEEAEYWDKLSEMDTDAINF